MVAMRAALFGAVSWRQKAEVRDTLLAMPLQQVIRIVKQVQGG